MRWSFWPVSITAHVLAGLAMLIVPLTADVTWPVPAPLHPLSLPTKVVPVPPEVVATVPATRAVPNLPNVVAPATLAPERKVPAARPGVLVPDLPSSGTGPIDPGLLGPAAIAVPGPPPTPVPAPKAAAQVVRVGQGVREPKRIAGAPPEYPPLARSARVQGVVILEAVIDAQGTIELVKVLKSVPLLDGAAVAAVKGWRYTPTLLNGVPVSVLMTITMNFTLQD
jgi:protein TonB